MILKTSTEVLAALRRSLCPDVGLAWPGGTFLTEIEAPRLTRQRARRADAVWVPKPGRRLPAPTLNVYEVKVTRADLRIELADLAKAWAWKQYADYFWLVVGNPSLVAGLDIPEDWGILAPPSHERYRKMTVVRDATRLNPLDQRPAFARIAARLSYEGWAKDLTQLLETRKYRAEIEFWKNKAGDTKWEPSNPFVARRTSSSQSSTRTAPVPG